MGNICYFMKLWSIQKIIYFCNLFCVISISGLDNNSYVSSFVSDKKFPGGSGRKAADYGLDNLSLIPGTVGAQIFLYTIMSRLFPRSIQPPLKK